MTMRDLGDTSGPFYHFTAKDRLEMIQADGIMYGDVPTSMSEGFNAVWLTTDPNPGTQNWAMGDYKRAIRLTVYIPNDEYSNLWKWVEMANRLDVDKGWREILNVTGGNKPSQVKVLCTLCKTYWV
mgnify:CR=1 FL=1